MDSWIFYIQRKTSFARQTVYGDLKQTIAHFSKQQLKLSLHE
ncbi:hypothetical protein CRENPOLYSF2_160024 [Crenothrix polyspora]|uniref:Transposase n=1 Tax=Crenothrix polyspora TaxID=360316 RepID=A0A1R4H285_9GAMM|nr:hypothetical protein CRENPOLYSF2_160024 [Crenothrix polyspora]